MPTPGIPLSPFLQRRLRGLTALLVGLCACSSLAQTAFLNFNTPGQYTNNFSPFEDVDGTNGGIYSFEESTNDGVGGSGGVSVYQSNDTTATYKSGSWDFSTNGAVISLAVLVNANGQFSGNKIQLGVKNSNTNALNGNPGVAFETYRVIPSSATVWSVREQYQTGGTLTEVTNGNVNILIGEWYKFVISVTNTGGASGSYTAGCALYDYGTDGLTPGANLITFPTGDSHAGQTDITVSAMWPSLRGFQDAGFNAWDNFLVYTPASKPVLTLALTNMTAGIGNTAAFTTLADGPGSISFAWYTNGILAAGASGVNYTTPPLTTGYSNVAVVASNSNGSTTNTATLSVIAVSAATITNLPASNVQGSSAVLNGQVLSTGGQVPALTLYYGPADGGSTAALWANNIYLGTESGSFAVTVTGLSTNTSYYYTVAATNAAGLVWASPSQSFTTLPAAPMVSVLTYHNDNARDGANTNETLLTPGTLNAGNFGRLMTYAVDGFVFAQPLYVAHVAVPGQGTHNVVYVATENDSIYAFDADNGAGANGGLLWHTNLGTAALSSTGEFGTRYNNNTYIDLTPKVGMTGTPVIDPVSGTLYVDVLDRIVTTTTNYYHRIHALNLTNGLEQSYSPVTVTASVAGTGVGGNGTVVTFNPQQQNQRPALTLAGGILYVAYGSFADTDPYHGWVMGFSATNLQQLTNYIFNTTPNATTGVFGANAGEGALWMGGNGLCVDGSNNLFFETANGSFSAQTNGGDYSDSFVKLFTTNRLAVADYFTPADQGTLATNDLDLGSGGPLLLPDAVGSTAHRQLMAGGGKQGIIFLVDRNNLGTNSGTDRDVQEVSTGLPFFSTPAYFNYTLYCQGKGTVMDAFAISNGIINPTPVSVSGTAFKGYGTTPSISANGNSDGIVWTIQTDGSSPSDTNAAILHAYNATNVALELYNSGQNAARDNPGGGVKYTVPMVANGKVYVGAQYTLSVYGYLPFLATPAISPNGSVYTNSVIVTLSDATPGAAIYYTLDGTQPTTNSTLYTGPIDVSTTLNLQAVAVQSGAANSAVASASFIYTAVPPAFTSVAFTAGGLQLGVSGAADSNTYVLEASTNLIDWTPILTNQDAGLFNFLDPNAGHFPYRFYRVLEQ